MFVRVTCEGVLIGVAELDRADGIAHATMSPTPAYTLVAAAARAVARELAQTKLLVPEAGDFADVAAMQWTGGRLALEDASGREYHVANVLVLDGPSPEGAGRVRVVADFRSDSARVGARIGTAPPGENGRSRPAA